MKRKVVYVAAPISRGDLVENIERAHRAGAELLAAGLSPLVPHGSCFWGNRVFGVFPPNGLTRGFVPEAAAAGFNHEQWVEADLEFVRRSDAVLRLPGPSEGADREVHEARMLGLPVFYCVGCVLSWAGVK